MAPKAIKSGWYVRKILISYRPFIITGFTASYIADGGDGAWAVETPTPGEARRILLRG